MHDRRRASIRALAMVPLLLAIFGCTSPQSVRDSDAGVDASADVLAPPQGSDADSATPGDAQDATPGIDALPMADALPGRALTANDVSVLFPRTGAGTAAALWPPTLEGKGGLLLPLAIYTQIGRPLIMGVGIPFNPPAPAMEYEKLRVVAVRFDPCFGATACQPQVRLVLQAFQASGGVFDGAVHLLYNLTTAEFRLLLADLRALTSLAPENKAGLSLGPSPALTAQGTTGAYGLALRALVTRYAGEGNLARMTFMARTPSGNATWQFGGVNLKFFAPAGEMDIPNLPLGTRLQSVSRPTGVGEYAYSLFPGPATHLAELQAVIDAPKAMNATPAARAAAYDALVRIENPTLENPDSADCASCHIANRLRGYLDKNFPPAMPSPSIYAGLAASPRVIGGAETDDSNLRIFGHFDDAPGAVQSGVISQRVANETHRVLQMLQTM